MRTHNASTKYVSLNLQETIFGLLLVVAFFFAGSVSAAVFTVGADEACDFHDLQEAIWSTWFNDIVGPSADEIHIARNQTYMGEYVIEDQEVKLRGGFDDCADSTPSGRTKIVRPAGQRLTTGPSCSILTRRRGLVLSLHRGRRDAEERGLQRPGGLDPRRTDDLEPEAVVPLGPHIDARSGRQHDPHRRSGLCRRRCR